MKSKSVLLSLDWYESRIHNGLLRYAQKKGWVLHADTHGLGFFQNLSVNGLILSASSLAKGKKMAEELGAPFVFLFDVCEGSPSVCLDNIAIGRMAGKFFIERNFKRVTAFFPHPYFLKKTFRDRIKGCEEALFASGVLFDFYQRDRSLMSQSESKENNAKINFYKDYLKNAPKPLGVFLMQDSDAVFLQLACNDLGISIPEEVAILSVNNEPMICPYTPVPLSSIDPGWENVGFYAGAMLNSLLEGEDLEELVKYIPPIGIEERLSSSIIAVEDRRVADAVSYIWQKLDNDPSVDDICRAIRVPRRSLTAAFKKHLGRGVKEEVQLQRIKRIQSLLLETKLTTVEIAYKLNFRSEFYLYKFFKKHTGMTTKAYRKQIKP
ncbi:MAG: substrate-binding domain-containing protein [Lentisphaeria bacterium]|nr:substrate-binding domain-containing protein [Lentisphaeria bacterium]